MSAPAPPPALPPDPPATPPPSPPVPGAPLPPHPGPAPAPPAGSPAGSPPVLWSLYRLMLRTTATRGRLVTIGLLGLVAVFIGWVVGQGRPRDILEVSTFVVSEYGLGLLVPVCALVFASSALGDANEDGTLVYLWLRPVGRWKIAVAAYLASLTIVWPLTVPVLAVAAWATRAPYAVVPATVAAATVEVIAYVGIFLALGFRTRRALLAGLLYIFVWENFIARAGGTTARLAVRAYGQSTLRSVAGSRSDVLGIELALSQVDPPWTWIIPVLVAAAAVAYTTYRLRRQDVP
jgi:ABC-2 type transport system permease protein